MTKYLFLIGSQTIVNYGDLTFHGASWKKLLTDEIDYKVIEMF